METADPKVNVADETEKAPPAKRGSIFQRLRRRFTLVFRRRNNRNRTKSESHVAVEKREQSPSADEKAKLRLSLSNGVPQEETSGPGMDAEGSSLKVSDSKPPSAKVPLFVNDFTSELKQSLKLRSKKIEEGETSPTEAIQQIEGLRTLSCISDDGGKWDVKIEIESKTFEEKRALFESQTSGGSDTLRRNKSEHGDTSDLEEEGKEKKEKHDLEEKEKHDLKEKEKHDLEEKEKHDLEEKEKHDLEEKEKDLVEKYDLDGLENEEKHDLKKKEEKDRKDVECVGQGMNDEFGGNPKNQGEDEKEVEASHEKDQCHDDEEEEEDEKTVEEVEERKININKEKNMTTPDDAQNPRSSKEEGSMSKIIGENTMLESWKTMLSECESSTNGDVSTPGYSALSQEYHTEDDRLSGEV